MNEKESTISILLIWVFDPYEHFVLEALNCLESFFSFIFMQYKINRDLLYFQVTAATAEVGGINA